jgi:hypothetical protein
LSRCIKENQLAIYARGVKLDPQLRAQIEAHVPSCRLCTLIVEEERVFSRLSGLVPSAMVDKIAARVLRAGRASSETSVFILEPYRPAKPAGKKYLLAAEGKSERRYENVQSYVNHNEDIVARVIKNNDTGELMLYLLSDEKKGRHDKVLEIEGCPRVFVFDAEGRALLSGLSEKFIDKKKIFLRSPLARFNLEPVPGLETKVLFEGCYNLDTPDLDSIRIELKKRRKVNEVHLRVLKLKGQGAAHDGMAVLFRKKGQVASAPIRRGAAVFEGLDLQDVLKIKIY